MNKTFKIVIAGAFNAGKSSFIRTVSDIEVVSTERRISDDAMAQVKETTTVAMDYGQVTVGDKLLHLYGTPGQERFEFMWDILAQEMDGILILVDSADRPALTLARRILRRFRRKSHAPLLVVATKQEAEDAMTSAELATALHVDPSEVVSCDPRSKPSARETLKQLLARIK